jgi:hypothetical protein
MIPYPENNLLREKAMLASMLLGYLLVEWVIYGVIGGLLWYYGDRRIEIIVIFAVTLSVMTRLGYVIFMFIVAWVYRVERPAQMQIGFVRAVRLFLAEFAVFLALYWILQPLERWLIARDPKPDSSPRGLPVLLIHGFFCNGGYWWAMKRFLRKRGVNCVFTINLEPIVGRLNINRFAEQIEARIEHICSVTGKNRVILIGHSMGGLASRVYLHRYGGQRRVAKLITLGTPHHGTQFAVFFHRAGIRQMQSHNPWLAKLNTVEKKPALIPVTSIYSYHDTIVLPQDSCKLDHAKNIPLAGIGHLEMSFSRLCQRLVYEEILATGND